MHLLFKCEKQVIQLTVSVDFNDYKQYKSVASIVYKGIIQAYKTNHGGQGVQVVQVVQVGKQCHKIKGAVWCNRFSKSLFLVTSVGVWGHGNTETQGHKITEGHVETRSQVILFNRCVGNKVNVSLQSSCLCVFAVQVYRAVTFSPISPYHTITQCPLISIHKEHTVSRFTRYHGRHNCKGYMTNWTA